MPCPDTCTVSSGHSVPEKTRTRWTRRACLSTVVPTTSATSGPSGSQLSGGRGEPSSPVTAGTSCSSGDGNADTRLSSSTSSPTPVAAQTGTTGWRWPLATAFSRSVISTSVSISSPSR